MDGLSGHLVACVNTMAAALHLLMMDELAFTSSPYWFYFLFLVYFILFLIFFLIFFFFFLAWLLFDYLLLENKCEAVRSAFQRILPRRDGNNNNNIDSVN